jgi:(R,R)-butanediol dehydrogenase/meso-butanediol dehydrogenase/diacetyl reductase
VELVDKPAVGPGGGEVLIEVLAASVCGSDVHAVEMDGEGYSKFSGPAEGWDEGLRLGHEYVGRVLEHGPGVSQPEIGTLVTGDSVISCGTCHTCKTGRPNYCREAYLIGFQQDGIFGRCACVPARSVYPIDKVIDRYGQVEGIRVATQCEPIGCSLHAFDQGRRRTREENPSVLVLGAGPIGTYIAVHAALEGCSPVVVLEPSAFRASIARQYVDMALDPDEYDSNVARDVFGAGPSLIFEACGEVDLEEVFGQLGPGGTLVTVARTGQQAHLPADTLVSNGTGIVGCRGHVGFVPKAIDLLALGRVDPFPFITKTLGGLEELVVQLRHPAEVQDEFKVVCAIGGLAPNLTGDSSARRQARKRPLSPEPPGRLMCCED